MKRETVKEYHLRTGVPITTIYQRIKYGKIEHEKIGNTYIILSNDTN